MNSTKKSSDTASASSSASPNASSASSSTASSTASSAASSTATASSSVSSSVESTHAGSIDEIRSYHYNPELFDGYKDWANNHALPYLREHLNLIGFWLDSGIAPEIGGEQPTSMPLGVANVTWIIRWDSMESRAEALPRVFGTEEFQAILARIPDVKGYFQMESRFTHPV